MKKNWCFSAFFIVMICNSLFSLEPQDYLEGRIINGDKRRNSFLLALKLLSDNHVKVMVETGTARYGTQNFWGDGGSTIIFGEWASHNDADFFTVDLANWAMENAKNASKAYEKNINYVVGDSIEFLKKFNKPIDFLYLDSFDFDENNPLPSQEHHLKEIIAAYPFLHEKTIVMIDDCALPYGGKGTLAIEYLISKNWNIIFNGYQTILSR